MKKTSIYMKFLSFILSLFLAIPLNVVSALAAATTMEIKHESQGEYYPGFRINLDAEIEDDVGVMVARCYFKTKKQENFVFVNMAQEPDSHYLATLPAPWVNSESIDYVFVVVNKEKKVVRSQVFTIEEEDTEAAATWEGMGEVKEIRLDVVQEAVEEYEVIGEQLRAEVKGKLSKYQKDLDQGQLDVNTELDRASEKLRDFYDRNVVVSEVPDHLKYGLLAEGLYAKEQIDKAGGVLAVAESTGAASAGSIKADDGGLPWGWIALGTVAVGGGVAAAVGSGGGGGGSHHDSGAVDVTQATTQDFVGTYTLRDPSRSYEDYHGSITFSAGGTFSSVEYLPGETRQGSGTWSWDQGSQTFSIDWQPGGAFSGQVTGNTNDFTLAGLWNTGDPGTLRFQR